MSSGTQIEVRDLFWNTPARLKLMKSEATEAANIAEAVLRLALAHPEVHFLQTPTLGVAESDVVPRAREHVWQEPLRGAGLGADPVARQPATESRRARSLAHTVEGLDIPREEPIRAPVPHLSVVRGPGYFASLEYVGQIHATYLICEGEKELVIVDQHAAHERITFERLRQSHGQRQVPRQRLLFPIPIELDMETASGFEGITTLYYDRISVTVRP
jgi:DNA mismatch repair ATPase MutL